MALWQHLAHDRHEAVSRLRSHSFAASSFKPSLDRNSTDVASWGAPSSPALPRVPEAGDAGEAAYARPPLALTTQASRKSRWVRRGAVLPAADDVEVALVRAASKKSRWVRRGAVLPADDADDAKAGPVAESIEHGGGIEGDDGSSADDASGAWLSLVLQALCCCTFCAAGCTKLTLHLQRWRPLAVCVAADVSYDDHCVDDHPVAPPTKRKLLHFSTIHPSKAGAAGQPGDSGAPMENGGAEGEGTEGAAAGRAHGNAPT